MGYYKVDGQLYGIKIYRPIWKTILLHLPIINLFYTYRATLDIVGRDDRNRPTRGCFEHFRIFKNQKSIKFGFIPLETEIKHALLKLDIQDKSKTFIIQNREGVYFPGIRYVDRLQWT